MTRCPPVYQRADRPTDGLSALVWQHGIWQRVDQQTDRLAEQRATGQRR